MKRSTLLALGLGAMVLLGSSYAVALSCIEPGYNATLTSLSGGPEGLCLSTTGPEVVIKPCDRRSAFDDEVYR